MSGAIDLTPTLCDLTGIGLEQVPQSLAQRFIDNPLDGISHASRLTMDAPEVERELFSQWSGRIGMRRGPYLLDADGKLFDLIADPGQRKECNEQYPDVVQQMQEKVEKWRVDVLKSAKPRRPFLIGHLQRSWASLPAQDGKCAGPNVVRSNTAPNCSYFTRIHSPEDRVRWEV
ncbi:MAG: N-acetylgalactosamine 6-sulfate sulfatase, partial [Bacteroidota bacterium]